MSYILDALKKNQAEQAETGVNLQPPRRGASRWLATGLVVVLVLNLALLAWIVLDKSVITGPESPTSVTAAPQTVQPTAADTAETSANQPASEAEPIAQRPAVIIESVAEPVVEAEPAAAVTVEVVPTSPATPAPAARQRTVQPTALADLPAQEQILYNGFNYSTHIYTDDPELCAVVIDGERLTAGDSFKGLKLIAITETGVIFEENRRGQRRQVAVSVLEQWERQ